MATPLIALLALGFGAFLGYFFHQRKVETELGGVQKQAGEIVERAKKEGEQLLSDLRLEQKETLVKARAELEEEFRTRRQESERREQRMDQRETNLQRQNDLLSQREEDINRRLRELDQRFERLKEREEKLDQREAGLKKKEKGLASRQEEVEEQLIQVAGLTREEAKQGVIKSMMDEARTEAARKMRQLEEETRADAEKKARKIIALATQRYANDFVNERTVSVVHLASDDMKGRIIGREGRNIRALEAATGVDLIIDDTPEAVVVSCFDPIRREIGRRSLEKLLVDGRIHPARIEEVVEKTREEMDKLILEAGEEAVLKVGLSRVHPEIKKLFGRLKWRYSYGQNQWEHSIECAFLCGMMAAELGMNQKVARRAALFHDIGKALTFEMEGSHAINGANFLQKYGESNEVVHAVAAHHEEVKPETALALLVMTADSLSGGRPGARREALESYIQRLRDLEEIAMTFDGVEKAYAIQAGREIRVITCSDQLNDEAVYLLSADIAKKIEREMTYPGQIKVTVIRETRVVEFAR